MKLCSLITFILQVTFGWTKNDVNITSLRFVHAVWRHGDRNPQNVYPTDKANGESTWPQGFGELTQTGIAQHYELGQFIKNRYKGFLKDDYDSREIYVRSTDYNRTIMSALANMAGMYPPTMDKAWNKTIHWQPVPVHSRPRETDFMLWTELPCPAATKVVVQTLLLSPEAKHIAERNREFFEFLQNKTGIAHINLTNMYAIMDPLFCENYHRDIHPWPAWVNQSVYEKIIDLVNTNLRMAARSVQLQRFRGGSLFHDIASRMKKKSLNNSTLLDTRLKYYVYSVHDSTMISLLANMDAYDGVIPPYASAIFLELHERGNNFYVEVYYRNGTSSNDLHKINVPSCSPCTIDLFLKLAEAKKPDNWWLECGYNANSTNIG